MEEPCGHTDLTIETVRRGAIRQVGPTRGASIMVRTVAWPDDGGKLQAHGPGLIFKFEPDLEPQ